jgi:integrase
MAHLTEKFIEKIEHRDKEQIFRDDDNKGLILRVGKHRKAWSFRSEAGDGKLFALGKYKKPGSPDHVSLAQARLNAEKARAGVLTVEPKEGPATIRSTWPAFKQNRRDKGRAANTIADLYYSMNRLSDKILDMPLAKLSNAIMHDEIMRIRANPKHGAFAGNNTVRFVRGIYRFARLFDKTLPDGHPCEGVAMVPTNYDEQKIMPPEHLPVWRAEVEALSNPVHSAMHKWIMFSGMRLRETEALRWEHIDRAARIAHVPKTKNGKALNVPLSGMLLKILDDAQKAGETFESPWVFPGESKAKLDEDKNVLLGPGRVTNLTPVSTYTAHDYRRTYSTEADAIGVDLYDIDRLTNHVAKGITAKHYIKRKPNDPRLLEKQEQISQHLQGLMVSHNGTGL